MVVSFGPVCDTDVCDSNFYQIYNNSPFIFSRLTNDPESDLEER